MSDHLDASADLSERGRSSSDVTATKRVKRACVPCSKSKTKCDDGRPCQRCLRKGISAQCVDRVTSRDKREVCQQNTPVLPDNSFGNIFSLVDWMLASNNRQVPSWPASQIQHRIECGGSQAPTPSLGERSTPRYASSSKRKYEMGADDLFQKDELQDSDGAQYPDSALAVTSSEGSRRLFTGPECESETGCTDFYGVPFAESSDDSDFAIALRDDDS
eukprot:gb/GECG01005365.1/.p1 GENE.gb/GECG01005365.1/~~gb/GECG01005365.1/.p1  ORF type:complete len:218 (+),score=22.29 gb/GECG01005365.1/:1-654(+)